MATSGSITVKIHGLDALRSKLHGARADAPVQRFLDRGAIFTQGKGRAFAKVDTGRLRNSIGVEKPTPRSRRIGPNVFYGPYVEFGTQPHWPPPGALAGWAKRHGAREHTVRRAIARRGTRARPYMRPAASAAESFLRTLVPVLAAELEAAYARGD